jgi:hypothetical protein
VLGDMVAGTGRRGPKRRLNVAGEGVGALSVRKVGTTYKLTYFPRFDQPGLGG